MKANHNENDSSYFMTTAVLAVSKVLNLKANHNDSYGYVIFTQAVLAVSKVLNLKANHNTSLRLSLRCACCISCIEGTEFES